MAQYRYDNCLEGTTRMKRASGIVHILGGTRALGRRVSSERELLVSLNEGLPYRALESVKQRLHLSDSELAEAMGIHPRTMARRKSQERLGAIESDRLSRLARLLAHATEVLGSEDNAVAWLRHPNRALGGVSPLRYLNTDLGAKRVEAVLSHIEWGDLS